MRRFRPGVADACGNRARDHLIEVGNEICGNDLSRLPSLSLGGGYGLLRECLVVDRERKLLLGHVRDRANLQHTATIWGTYGGDQVSTWSILRLSCKPRSPVGLVKQPGTNASAKNTNALALAA